MARAASSSVIAGSQRPRGSSPDRRARARRPRSGTAASAARRSGGPRRTAHGRAPPRPTRAVGAARPNGARPLRRSPPRRPDRGGSVRPALTSSVGGGALGRGDRFGAHRSLVDPRLERPFLDSGLLDAGVASAPADRAGCGPRRHAVRPRSAARAGYSGPLIAAGARPPGRPTRAWSGSPRPRPWCGGAGAEPPEGCRGGRPAPSRADRESEPLPDPRHHGAAPTWDGRCAPAGPGAAVAVAPRTTGRGTGAPGGSPSSRCAGCRRGRRPARLAGRGVLAPSCRGGLARLPGVGRPGGPDLRPGSGRGR